MGLVLFRLSLLQSEIALRSLSCEVPDRRERGAKPKDLNLRARKGGDCFASLAMTLRGGVRLTGMALVSERRQEHHHRDFSVAASRLARNDSFLANVILRHIVPKNLVPHKKYPYVRRTRCLTEFSLRSPRPKGVGSAAEWVQHDKFLRTVIPALFHGLAKSQMGALG